MEIISTSWSKAEGIDNLIGRKRVDWSVFQYGTHIPLDMIDAFVGANAGKRLERGEKQAIVLLFKDVEYPAILTNIDRKGVDVDTLQIRYSDAALKEAFRESFSVSYDYILQQREGREDKSQIVVPDEFAEYLDFYDTRVPFKYKLIPVVKTGSFSKSTYLTPSIKYFINPTLQALHQLGSAVTIEKLNQQTFIIMNLSQEQLDEHMNSKNGERRTVPEYRAAWARTYLGKTGYIEQNDGKWVLTERGEKTERIDDLEALIKMVGQSVNTWLFQANPKYFDLRGALDKLQVITWDVNQCKKLIRLGEKVFFWESGKEGGILASAMVEEGPAQLKNLPEEAPYEREQKAEWADREERLRVRLRINEVFNPYITRTQIMNHPVLKDLEILKFANATNYKLKLDQVEAIEKFDGSIGSYTLEELAKDTYLPEEKLKDWLVAIQQKKQAVLYGPPGTGKTFVAQHLAKYLVQEQGITDLIQFHPAYAYEDFMQGIRPKSDAKGQVSWILEKGRFLSFCEQAGKYQGNCVLIIDEINRANLARVFGELMFLLEYRDRKIELAGGGFFEIPANVILVGTMNTADRSIALVDYALRRRFAFLAMQPDYEVLNRYHETRHVDNQMVSRLIGKLSAINEAIGDENFQLGVSFFMVDDLSDRLPSIWKYEIEPYLEEYFYDSKEKREAYYWHKVKADIL
ncbi:AAA family ATPase [Anaeroarcus burkinensis]|uniref:AAA family ATPase n=1 Tax=Anaeroarcus burkinensis TaxID=82376 RepID=UPI0004078E42|nr:AAA family ATPase [Anaeroarcus burkinensis]